MVRPAESIFGSLCIYLVIGKKDRAAFPFPTKKKLVTATTTSEEKQGKKKPTIIIF
jgi:hypothetical protein